MLDQHNAALATDVLVPAHCVSHHLSQSRVHLVVYDVRFILVNNGISPETYVVVVFWYVNNAPVECQLRPFQQF